MRHIQFTAIALVVAACGAQSATVGERFDEVEDHNDGGTEASESVGQGNPIPANPQTPAEPGQSSEDTTSGPGSSQGPSNPAAPPGGSEGSTSSTTNPGVTNPGATDPGTTDPGTTDPGSPPPVPPPRTLVEAEPCANTAPIGLGAMTIVERLTAWLGVEADQALLDAADAGALLTYGDVECQARRLVQQESHRAALRVFLGSWLEVDDWSRPSNPELSPQVREQMLQEAKAFLDTVAAADTPTFDLLLSGNERLLGPELAAHYGVELPDGGSSATVEVAWLGGFLTLGLLTSSTPRIGGRGNWIQDQFACFEVGAPDAQALNQLPVSASETYRQRHNIAIDSAACQACHRIIDSAGFALENFDELGRYQTEEAGQAIDPSGALYLEPPTGNYTYENVAELSNVLVSAEPVRWCLASKILSHAKNDSYQGDDATRAAGFLLHPELDLRELFVAATQAPYFWE